MAVRRGIVTASKSVSCGVPPPILYCPGLDFFYGSLAVKKDGDASDPVACMQRQVVLMCEAEAPCVIDGHN
jgi:hypothetical protein